jgi:hypothetical protein
MTANNLGIYSGVDNTGAVRAPWEKPLFIDSPETTMIGKGTAYVRKKIGKLFGRVMPASFPGGAKLNPFNGLLIPKNMIPKVEKPFTLKEKGAKELVNTTFARNDKYHLGHLNIKDFPGYVNFNHQSIRNVIPNANPLNYVDIDISDPVSVDDYVADIPEDSDLRRAVTPAVTQLVDINNSLFRFAEDNKITPAELEVINNFKNPLQKVKKKYEEWYLEFNKEYKKKLKKLKSLGRADNENLAKSFQKLHLSRLNFMIVYERIEKLFNHVVDLVNDPGLLLDREGVIPTTEAPIFSEEEVNPLFALHQRPDVQSPPTPTDNRAEGLL